MKQRYAREDFTPILQAVSGEKLPLSSFKGRVIFLNTWAIWCKPCLAEMSSIERLFESLKGEPVAFLLISDEDPDRLKGFATSKRLAVPVYVWIGEPPPAFKTKMIPATFITDRAGYALFRHVGAAKWDGKVMPGVYNAFGSNGEVGAIFRPQTVKQKSFWSVWII